MTIMISLKTSTIILRGREKGGEGGKKEENEYMMTISKMYNS